MDIRRWGAWFALFLMPAVSWLATRIGIELSQDLAGAWRVEDVVVVTAAFGAAALAGYLAVVGLGIVAVALATGMKWPGSLAHLAPPVWRAVAGVALGMGLATGAGTGALAQPQGDHHVGWIPGPPAAVDATDIAQTITPEPSTGAEPTVAAPPSELAAHGDLEPPALDSEKVSPLVLVGASTSVDPEPTVTGFHQAPPASAARAQHAASAAVAGGATYTVVRGDSLWAITAGLLGPNATVGDIAQAWPLLYDANRGVVGADPSLIFAGQVLQIPGGLR